MRESKKKIIFALVMALFMVNIAYAARIEGIVIDGQDGGPLPGVSILVRGSKVGMMTDVDGKFSIEATEGSVLTFSYIGYHAKEYRVGASVTVKIAMESESLEMNEVVVVVVI
jgi:iron complex outermembrane receptor protein